ncbi:MAG: bifunctional diaminohydroxyphosphoribosylaminopyrimidine deaminase/5-amino-6-(5-phosphoribosylamino)uracil reductase RibD [Candidatus Omnitrophota bacterium]
MPEDILFMRRALILAGKGRGAVSPNPMVGCVIVKGRNVIGEGWHRKYGGDHAEVEALKKAGSEAKGAVMYVNLEPCAHWGHTPPCIDAVIASGVKRVVIAMLDPNSLTNGKSVKKMRRAGIEVVTGVCEADARELNVSFIKFISKKLPYTVAKTAQTLDGRIATAGGDSKWITSNESRDHARGKRHEYDAILVGVGTVLADDPCLDAPGKTITKVIVDSRLRIPLNARVLKCAPAGAVIVAATRRAPGAKVKRLEKSGVRVILCPEKNGRVDLLSLFKALAKNKIASILIEGGAAVIGSALKAGLLDELRVYIAPRIMGDVRATPSIVGLDARRVTQLKDFHLIASERLGPDILLTLKA